MAQLVTAYRQLAGDSRRRAGLRVYLQYAPGAGGTTAMLDEARRRAGRGTDVVVAACRVHGDASQALTGLEVLAAPGAGRTGWRRLDVEAVLTRNPEVVCVDDLSLPDAGGRPCWESVPRLLQAGITVLATLHLPSLRGTAAGFREEARVDRASPLVDDALQPTIDGMELVDIPPDDLVQRFRDGRLVSPAELARMLQRELRPPLLRALREAAFRLVADHADRKLVGYLRESGLRSSWEARVR